MSLEAALNTQFVQIALPITVTFMVASMLQNKRFDDLNKRIDELGRPLTEIGNELREIRNLLQKHDQRITASRSALPLSFTAS